MVADGTNLVCIFAMYIHASTTADDIQAAIDALNEFTATGSADPVTIIAEPADAAAAAGVPLIDINALNPGADYNNVAINFVAGTADSARVFSLLNRVAM